MYSRISSFKFIIFLFIYSIIAVVSFILRYLNYLSL